jgi:hypothetical protein
MLYPYNPATIRLTDDIERELVLHAIEEQFRPHPLRALMAWMRKLARPLHTSSSKTAHA